MAEIQSKVALVTKFVLKFLEDQNIINQSSGLRWKNNSAKSATVVIVVEPETASKVFKKHLSDLEVVALEMGNSEKCMVNICSDDDSLVQGIFQYSTLFGEQPSLSFPISESEINSLYTDEVFKIIQTKFKLFAGLSGSALRERPSRSPRTDELQSKDKDDIFKERVERMVANQPPRNPQIPGFDDEYEIQTGPGIPSSGEFGVPGLGLPVSGYGDNDLYPNGLRFPQDFDPLNRNSTNQQGGMIYDPFRGTGPSPNPQSGNHDPGQNSSPAGPQFPGTKYDDPYGRINRQGGGGGFI